MAQVSSLMGDVSEGMFFSKILLTSTVRCLHGEIMKTGSANLLFGQIFLKRA